MHDICQILKISRLQQSRVTLQAIWRLRGKFCLHQSPRHHGLASASRTNPGSLWFCRGGRSHSRYFTNSPHHSTRSSRLWRPAAFTLMVGATSYSMSAIYGEELKAIWMKRQRFLVSKDQNGILHRVRRWWLSISPADRFCYTIIALNTGVFLLWRMPQLHLFMERYFISSVTKKSSLSLLLSEFSHTEIWHIAVNMLVFWSFAPSLLYILGDRVSSHHAWPYYITGGVFASMVGFYSGALMALISLVVINNPDASVYLIFLPFIPIPAGYALAGVVTLDLVGVIRGWQFFDHAGHLGGVLFAVLYQWWLHRVIAKNQAKVARTWNRVKSRGIDTS